MIPRLVVAARCACSPRRAMRWCVFTRGEAGIAGMGHSEAAAIRVVESENACKVTGARHIFMNQVDGNTEVNLERYKEMRELIDRENPDIVMTHWPLDGHRDHAICGILVMDSWRRLDRRFKLFYFEAMSGTQSQLFHPTHWVNIERVLERKHEACNCHVSQHMENGTARWRSSVVSSADVTPPRPLSSTSTTSRPCCNIIKQQRQL